MFFLTVESIPSFWHLIYSFQMLADMTVVLEGYSNKGKISALPLFPIPLHSLPGFLRTHSREGIRAFICNCKNKTNKWKKVETFRNLRNQETILHYNWIWIIL